MDLKEMQDAEMEAVQGVLPLWVCVSCDTAFENHFPPRNSHLHGRLCRGGKPHAMEGRAFRGGHVTAADADSPKRSLHRL
jgi:hypothetical protein